MHIRIDPVAGDAPVRLLRVESIGSRRREPSEEREERRREERGASYAPAPQADAETYVPPADALPAEPVLLDGGLAALAARPPLAPPAAPALAAPVPQPARDEEEQSLYPSGTPAWMTALLKARG